MPTHEDKMRAKIATRSYISKLRDEKRIWYHYMPSLTYAICQSRYRDIFRLNIYQIYTFVSI